MAVGRLNTIRSSNQWVEKTSGRASEPGVTSCYNRQFMIEFFLAVLVTLRVFVPSLLPTSRARPLWRACSPTVPGNLAEISIASATFDLWPTHMVSRPIKLLENGALVRKIPFSL